MCIQECLSLYTPVLELVPIFRTMGPISSIDFFIGVRRSTGSVESPSLSLSALFGARNGIDMYNLPIMYKHMYVTNHIRIHGIESCSSFELRKTLKEDFLDRTGDKVESAEGTPPLM